MSPKVEPIHALIALHRDQVAAASMDKLTDDESDKLSSIASATFWKVLDLGPRTPRGVAEYAVYVADSNESGDCPTNRVSGDDSSNTDVGAVALRKIAKSTARSINPEQVDPVYAAIDLCKVAMADNDALAAAEIVGRSPEAIASQQRLLQAGARWIGAFAMLVATPPTTLAGLEALCSFVLNFAEEWGGDDGEVVLYENWKELLKTLRLFALEAMAPTA